ncbi:ABC transporter ATP-binding protein uup [BD1-7 clade bacterium]|uniref:ATP-binding protein Uup n=1 Tax=BD1-7 clade bacterium TaxID=2029982 RepID=A0A5S9PQ36_9GAMM|nr:ABC transporter ATP-binding protein uup [BD1-7 clade bacterium]
MALIRLDEAQLAYGDLALLDHASFAIEEGDKIAVIGRNGAGKSSLMRVLSGTEKLDGGVLNVDSSVSVNYLAQELPPADETTVFDYLTDGLAALGGLLKRFEHLIHSELDDADLKELERVQSAIDHENGWDFQSRIHTALEELGLDAETTMGSLSGGWRKRLSIVQALISDPDVLLLDEPTNHLDIPAISWLQQLLQRTRSAIVLISHDRRFLNEIASRILWLDRGRIINFPGDYEAFLTGREEFLANEERQNALFDKRLAEEEKWIRQGIKARRTRNEGRVRALKSMRNERKARVDVKGNVSMQIDDTQKSGKLIAELEGVSYAYKDTPILRDVNLLIQRGDRIGVIGRNGAGKSTLIKLILGELEPDKGTIRLGTKQQVAYFDQSRAQLDDNQTVADSLSEGRESIEINGQQKHVISYLGDFLFTPARVRSPISTLSGGEKNRLLLARLFSKQANILVLDEPTNDLDIETLELLEELIDGFKGTVIVISHDREFVDQIVTSTIFIGDNGRVYDYVGGFDDLIRQHGMLWSDKASFSKRDTDVDVEDVSSAAEKTETNDQPTSKPVKLSYKVQRELDQLPKQIEDAENAIAVLEQKMADPAFFQQPHDDVQKATGELTDLQSRLEGYYERWEEIETMQS